MDVTTFETETKETMEIMTEEKQESKKKTAKKVDVRYMTVTAMLSAVGFILMFLDFAVPFMPGFIKMDLSELPALIGTFAFGPVCGVLICFIKNLLHLTITTTGGVGELSNFLLGASFVLPAGLLYKLKKNKLHAVLGAFFGAAFMGLMSIPSNYFVVYPFYYNFMPEEAILAAYQAIVSSMDNILECLICFNAPFTAVKGLLSAVITVFIYKPLSPILKGVHASDR